MSAKRCVVSNPDTLKILCVFVLETTILKLLIILLETQTNTNKNKIKILTK